MKTTFRVLLTLLFLGTLSFEASAQVNSWSANNQSPSTITTDKAVARLSFPREFKLFSLSIEPLRQQLFSIVGDNAAAHSTVIFLPNADGNYEQLKYFEASILSGVTGTMSGIRAFSGKALPIGTPLSNRVISPQGIQTMVSDQTK